MTDPQIISQDIQKGFEYYSYLIDNKIYTDQIGDTNSCSCDKSYLCLLYILKSLQWRLDLELYDEITEVLYNKLLLCTKTVLVSTSGIVFYGELSDNTIPTLGYILNSLSINIDNQSAEYIIPYTPSAGYKYLWFAEPATEPIKDIYIEVADPDNNGNIGKVTDFINKPILISGNINYNLYISNYPTIISGPYTFKASYIVESTIEFGYTNTDPEGIESGVSLQFSIDVPKLSSSYALDFTNNADLQYLIIKEPITEPVKTVWINTPIYNRGVIPDTKMRNIVVVGSFRYYLSKVPFALDSSSSIIILNVI